MARARNRSSAVLEIIWAVISLDQWLCTPEFVQAIAFADWASTVVVAGSSRSLRGSVADEVEGFAFVSKGSAHLSKPGISSTQFSIIVDNISLFQRLSVNSTETHG